MFKFPAVEPVIQIVDLPDRDLTITCNDLQTGFVPLELGADEEFAFYDYPSDHHDRLVFSGAHRVRVTQRIRVDRIDVLQIEAWYAETGADYAGKPAQWNQILGEQGLQGQIVIDIAAREPWAYSAGTNTPRPLTFYVGLQTTGVEPSYTTGIEPALTVNWQLEVMNAVELAIGPQTYRGLRIIKAYGEPGGNILDYALMEYFVAENGRTMLARRYNGPAATDKLPQNYADLAASPVLDFMASPGGIGMIRSRRMRLSSVPDQLINNIFTESRVSVMIVKTPSAVPNGTLRHSMQAITKQKV